MPRRARRRSSFLGLGALALTWALCLSFAPVLAAGPPVHVTVGPTPSVRLDELCIPATNGIVEVPIWVKNPGDADGLQVSIDYDEVFLGYAWYRTTNTNWRVERVSPYGRRRITLILKQNNKHAAPADPTTEEIALSAVFYLQDPDGSPDGRPFQTHLPLNLGANGPNGSIDTFFFTAAAGQDEYRPIKTRVTHGGLTIYYRDGVELSGGGITRTEQAFSLPLYLTYLNVEGAAHHTFTVAIDYDEVFLGLVGIMGVSPPLEGAEPGESPIPLIAEAKGSGIFLLTLAPDAPAAACRLHVANIYFKYNGLVPPDDHLLVEPSIIDEAQAKGGDEEPGDDGTDGGAGARTPGNMPGVLEFLPPFFVRGNVDSNVTFNSHGVPNRRGDQTDAVLILENVFLGGRSLPCADAADFNDSGRIELSDAVGLLNHLFRSGPPPAGPYPDPGIDSPLEDDLGCDQPLPFFEPEQSGPR